MNALPSVAQKSGRRHRARAWAYRVSHSFASLILTLLLCVGSSAIASSVPAVEFDGFDISTNNVEATAGWLFSTNESVIVTHLGVFDDLEDGLASAHDVGLWTDGGTLLATGTVSSGVVAPVENGFRYAAIDPVTLPSGQSFIVATNNPSPGDLSVGLAQNFVEHPAIDHINGRFVFGPGLLFPTQDEFADPSIFGANFKIVPVPEPSTLLLAGLGVLCATICRRPRRGVR